MTFTVNKVTTEKDNYAVVIINLPYKINQRISRDILSQPDPYNTITNLVLGNQRPSDLLASICNLQLETDCKCYCSRYQFLSRMPPITRAQLVSKKDLDLDKLVTPCG